MRIAAAVSCDSRTVPELEQVHLPANPDLPARLAVGGPYNTPDAATFYGGDHRGYTDYPTLPADSA